MKFPRILQIIVCLVLCVSIVFSLATPKAHAVAIVDDIGYIILMILAAAGIVFPASNAAHIDGLGTYFTGFMESEIGTQEEESAFADWCSDVGAVLSSDDRPVDPRLAIPDILLDLFSLFAVKVAVHGYEFLAPEAPDGYTYYNDILLPTFPYSTYPYTVIIYSGANFECYNTEAPFVVKDTNRFYASSASKCVWSMFYSDEVSWRPSSTVSYYSGQYITPFVHGILWSNYDIYSGNDVVFRGSAASGSVMDTVAPSVLVGPLSGVSDPSIITDDDISIPVSYDLSWLWDDTKTKDEVVFSTFADLSAGTLTHTDYLTMVQPSTEAGTEDDEDVVVGTLPVPTFWKGLTDVLSDVFVPDATYLASKVDALTSEFAFADSIISTGKMFGTELQDITTEPPVVYIDLPASTGSYDLGPRMPFVDLSWYAEYKPTGDALISAFLWAIFAWRMFQKLPAVISGMPGDFVMSRIDESGLSGHLPSRKKEYEETRRRNRRF